MGTNLLRKEIFGMQSGKEFYENIIAFIIYKFNEVFKDELVFIKKQVSIEHMGYFKIQYKYMPLQYDIIFENERNVFEIEIFDNEGAKNSLYRIEKYKSGLSIENIQDAILKLKEVLGKNNLCFYIHRDEKLYKKINGEYKRVKNLNELR